jgi:hypothetical protein
MSDQTTTVKVGFQTDTAGLDSANQQIKRMEENLKRLRASLSSGVSPTTGFDFGKLPPIPPGVSAPAGLPGGGGGGYNALMHVPGMAYMGRTAARTGMGALGALGVATGVTAAVVKSISEARQYLRVIDPLSKQLRVVGGLQEQFEKGLIKTGEAIGRNKTEMGQLVQTYIALAGQQKGLLANQTNVASLFAKGAGIDHDLMMSSMGGMAQMGAFGSYGGGGAERFALTLADAIARGGMAGREGELFGSIQSLMGAQLNILTQLAPGSEMSMIGALTAMNASGQPGLMGARGANVLGRMDNAVRNPSGEFAEYAMYSALGGGDWFDYLRRREEGIFGEGNYEAIDKWTRDQIKDPKQRYFANSQMLGISYHQAEAMDKIDPTVRSKLVDIIEDATGGNLEGITGDKFQIMANLLNSSGKEREELLRDSRLESVTRGKKWDANTDIKTILGAIAKMDLASTVQEELITNLSTLDNTIIDMGNKLIDSANKLCGFLADMTGAYGGESKSERAERQRKEAVRNKRDQYKREHGHYPGEKVDKTPKAAVEVPTAAPPAPAPAKVAAPEPVESVETVDSEAVTSVPVLPGTGKNKKGSWANSVNKGQTGPDATAEFEWYPDPNNRGPNAGPTPEQQRDARIAALEKAHADRKEQTAVLKDIKNNTDPLNKRLAGLPPTNPNSVGDGSARKRQ